MRRKISVIVPTLNEASLLCETLESILAQDQTHEIIVSDGGSVDATTTIATSYGRVVRSERGRARQMNAGARAADGDTFLFLHADTVLPKGALRAIRIKLRDPAVLAGAFRLRFDDPTPLLHVYTICARLPLRSFCFGDRGLFVRRAVFDEVGGYPDVPMFEDVEMVRLLHKRGAFSFLSESVTTSARRFHKHGPIRQQVRNAYLWLHYLAGTDPRRLTHRYPYRAS